MVIGFANIRFRKSMKVINKVLISAGLVAGLISPVAAQAAEKPVVVSFKMTPDSVDLANGSAQVSFELIVSNPTGIASQSTQVTLSDGLSNSIPTYLNRVDSPVNTISSNVTFKGAQIGRAHV